MSYSKYYVYKEQTSTDGGASWQYTGNETPSGESIGTYSTLEECEGSGPTPPGPSPYENQYFTIVPRGNGNIKLSGASSSFKYTYDSGATWNDATSATSISMTNGQKIMFKGTLREGRPVLKWGIGIFSASTSFDAEGNTMSLLYSDNYANKKTLIDESTLDKLFSGSSIVSAENMILPATATTPGCYSWMFERCRGLTKAPALPATVITNNCYKNMFYNCTSLITAPELPATTLETDVEHEGCCYCGMFMGCTSLTQSPILPAKVLSWGCYPEMFKGCTSLSKITCYAETNLDVPSTVHEWAKNVSQTGTFYKKAGASWPSGDSGIPTGWTVVEV